ncbi:MAG: fumarylacetoacetate hydrolase family protein [Candidatus Helarchaeota archaeon]|nr:fumarylacetoacetate hydrolase family protein [Candidatus Helarchaeota archaeon]
MKFLNYRQNGTINCGILLEPSHVLSLKNVIQFLGKDLSLVERDIDFFNNYISLRPELDEVLKKSSDKIEKISLTDVKILAPILKPSKIMCLGLNYRDHAEETGQKLPKLPMLFAKAPTAVIGMDDEIQIPKVRKKIGKELRPIQFLDYEVELAIVIGKECKRVLVEEAQNYILGYTILNDVSARMEQMADKQFFRSKSFDTFAPLGPWIVTSDEIQDPMNLNVECKVNGEIMQNSNTRNMNFNVYEIVSFISESITLLPGDIIGTGTPPGVGAARKPPKSLKAGDLIDMTIEKVGTLRNRVQG